ncbi:MAG TPA: hypothetical protein VMP01_17515 [Pirellulaceae bacterium]|nr:hypothetical protein [Pirellulaceae bacterium]
MRRILLLGGFGAALLLTTSANADWHEFWNRVGVDFHRNNAWPEPFVSADREVTREYFRIQVNNGWRMQNTIGRWFFDEETNQLNEAGEIKLRQVATQSPVHRRTVFVLMGTSPDVTAKRVESVQQTLAQMLPEGPVPQVLLTDVDLEAGSGAYYDKVSSAYNSSIPAPRLTGGSGGAK